ncbi:MAG: hypothetical protein U0163_17190 [Gemmatimonadaceae bacterium]
MHARKKTNIPLGLLILAVIGVAFYFGVNAIMSPWIYRVGGGRILPIWQGRADVVGPGGPYRLFVSFTPTATRVAGSHVRGNGWICTPAGVAVPIKVGGGTQRSVWLTMEGEAFHVYTMGYSAAAAANGRSVPPQLDLTGRWEQGALVLTDGGTIASAFTDAGKVAEAPAMSKGPAQRVVIRENPWGFFGFGKPCGPTG